MGNIKYIVLCLLMFLPASLQGQVVIEMEKDAGVYKVPCKVNGLKLKFIFDTGASAVSISSTVANMMLENDYLSEKDIIGNGYSQIANGEIVDHTKINLETIEIGGLVLNDVEAIVIHQQSAPLLLGQSAIQKLGKVSISGNKLSIQTYGNDNPYIHKNLTYSAEELNQIYVEANNYWENDNYLLAVEKYDILYNENELYLHDVIKYARCLSNNSVKRHDDALNVLLKHESDVLDGNYSDKSNYHYEICKAAYWAKEYPLCIKYASKCQYEAEFPMFNYQYSTFWMARSYSALGNIYQARSTFSSFISTYLKYMEISSTDCWDKDYKDDILADQYYGICLTYDTYGEAKKYYLIAAAWGEEEAIEVCKKLDWDYNRKPYDYVY